MTLPEIHRIAPQDGHASALELIQAIAATEDLGAMLEHGVDTLVRTTLAEQAFVAFVDEPSRRALRSHGMPALLDEHLLRRLRGLGEGAHTLRVPRQAAPLEVTCLAGDQQVRLFAGVGGGLPSTSTHLGSSAMVLLVLLRRFAECRRSQQTERFRRLSEIARRVAGSLDLNAVLFSIARDAAELLNAETSDIILPAEDPGYLEVVAAHNWPMEGVGIRFPADEGVSAQAMTSKEPLTLDDYSSSPLRVRAFDGYRWYSLACAPLVSRGVALGVLSVHMRSDASYRFSVRDIELLTAFADHAAIAIDNARRYQTEVRLKRDLELTSQELSRSLRLQQRLAEQVIRGQGVDGVASELSRLLGSPVVIQDALLHVLGGHGSEPDIGWRDLVVQDETDISTVREWLDDEQHCQREGQASMISLAEPPRVAVPVRASRDDLLGLLVVGRATPLSSLDAALLDVASTGIALELARRRAEIDLEQRLVQDLASDLVSGTFGTDRAVRVRAERLHCDLSRPRRLLVLAPAAQPSDADRTSPADETRVIAQAARDHVLGAGMHPLVSTCEGRVVVLAEDRDLAELRRLAGAIVTQARQRNGWRVIAALGDLCTEPVTYAPAYQRAIDVLDATEALGLTGDIVSIDDLGVASLFVTSARKDDLVRFAVSSLGPLLDPGNAVLRETLEAWISNGHNMSATASCQYLHVNTVAYRLKKIQQLIGADLSNADVRVSLTVATRIAAVAGLTTTTDEPR